MININPKLLPSMMIILSLLAAFIYAYNDITDWRHILYFVSGALIVVSVTF